jgi:predicted phosphodiesterase
MSDERLNEIHTAAQDLGTEAAAEKLGLAPETVRRRVREWRERNTETGEPLDERILQQVRERFTDKELRRILRGADVLPTYDKVYNDFSGEVLTIGAFTDPHLGSVYTNHDRITRMFDVFADQGVDFVLCTGDIHEGMSNRAGHVYECSHIGHAAQLECSREVLGQWVDTPMYLIDGNHDRWYIKSSGAKIVEELCASQGNLHFLGHDEADIEVQGITIRLWHGEDGSSYALSYRLQKIIEAFTGGDKPNILLCGHTHKSVYIFERNIHTVSLGCIQSQSKWMRGKRIAAHTGFYVIKMAINETGVAWFQPRFYPFYV